MGKVCYLCENLDQGTVETNGLELLGGESTSKTKDYLGSSSTSGDVRIMEEKKCTEIRQGGHIIQDEKE